MKIVNLFKCLLGTCTLALVLAAPAIAVERGTAAQAEAMVKKAVAYVKANGQAKAAEEFTNGSSFKDRDLYVSYYDMGGTNIAHGANPKLPGKNLIGLKDPDGKPILQMIVDQAKKGKGWTDTYKFRDPLTEKLADKVIYVERVDDSTLIAVGVYK